jgi:hypothetical protein
MVFTVHSFLLPCIFRFVLDVQDKVLLAAFFQ